MDEIEINDLFEQANKALEDLIISQKFKEKVAEDAIRSFGDTIIECAHDISAKLDSVRTSSGPIPKTFPADFINYISEKVERIIFFTSLIINGSETKTISVGFYDGVNKIKTDFDNLITTKKKQTEE
jgi:hypothetical protein